MGEGFRTSLIREALRHDAFAETRYMDHFPQTEADLDDEMTPNRLLRHVSYPSKCEDKPARDVIRSKPN